MLFPSPRIIYIINHNRRSLVREKQILMKICSYSDAAELFKLAEALRCRRLKKFVRQRLYKGLSTKRRMDYWKAVGKLYEKKRKHRFLYAELWKRKSQYEEAIIADVGRTYPSLHFFSRGQEGYNKLFRILKAVSLTFPRIGYCQGISFFSAIILLTLCNEEVIVLIDCRMPFG